MVSTATTKHPFGELLAQYRARRPGLTQTRLAELAGYDQAILTRMAQGKKDLTGPSGRERILRIIETLHDQNAIATLDEANALLLAADLPPLFERQPAEAKLITRFGNLPTGLRIRRTNLPALISSFIGRTSEIAEVRALLNTSRLVTLTGSGGAGKTRLAQRVAGDVLLHYPDGVWYAELAVLNDGGMIADAVMRAMGLVPSDQQALERITEHLRERHALLVLDNCEHLIDAVAAFAIIVLHACPRVTILATSREAMNVEGERAWRVPPMLPDEASRLFVERALATHNLPSAGDETVAHICERLDGMPLAIELAASRLQVMSLSDVAARLDDRFNLLAHGRRGALPRHQTLRAMIDWSYELLSEAEKIAFRRLGVFVGGWEIDLAESLIGNSALAMLTQLVNKSLVAVDDANRYTRYRLLETIREYALEKLGETGEMQAVQRSHAEAIAAWIEQAGKLLRSRDQKVWIDRVILNQANLFAALSWSFGSEGDAIIGCRIAGMDKTFWVNPTATLNAEHWIGVALQAMTEVVPPRVRASLHMLHAMYFGPSGTTQEIISEYEKTLQLFREADDQAGIADATFNIADLRLQMNMSDGEAWQSLHDSIALAESAGDYMTASSAILRMTFWLQTMMRFDEADALLHRCIERARKENDYFNLTSLLYQRGHGFAVQLRFTEALPCFEEATQIALQIQGPYGVIKGLGGLAENHRLLGNLPRALELTEQLLEFTKQNVIAGDHTWSIILRAKALNDAGNHQEALELLVERFIYYREYRVFHPDGYLDLFDALACVHAGLGDAKRAAIAAGAADMCLPSSNRPRLPNNEYEYAPYIAKARAALGDEAYEAARAAGRAMSLDEALAFVLDEGE